MNPPRFFSYGAVILFCVIVLLPIYHMVMAPLWASPAHPLENIASLFEDRQLGLVFNSIALAAGTACSCLLIGVPYAFLCFRTNLKAGNLFGWIYIVPVLIPPYIHGIVWVHMSPFLEKYFFFDVHSLAGAVLVLTCAYFPFVVLMTITGLKAIDRNLEEVSLIHHGKYYTLWNITLPLALPHILSGAIFVFIFSIINVSVPDILRVRAYPLEIFIQFSAFYDELAATILSLPLICLTFLLIALQKYYMKDRSYVQISGGQKKRILFELNRFHGGAFLFCLVVIGLTALFPVVLLMWVAGPLSTYAKALTTSIHQIGYSLLIAFLGSLATLLMGFSLAYLIKRSKSRFAEFLAWFVFLPFAIPATTVGIGLIGIWNRAYIDVIYGSSVIIILGYVARFVPFAVIICMSGIAQIGHHLEETAILSGSSFLNMLKKIVIPLSKQNMFAVLFIVFILSLGELGTTLLIIPPGRETIPIKIYNLMHYGADQMVAALCLILIGMVLVISGIFLVWYRKMTGAYQKIT